MPVYWGPKKVTGCVGIGCSEGATNYVADLYGVNRDVLNPTDAWFRRSAVTQGGGREVYNQNKGNLQSYADSLQVGDLVSLDRPKSPYAGRKDKKYVNEGIEHQGVVVGKDPDTGKPLVRHGSAHGDTYIQPYDALTLGSGLDYKVRSAYRPKALENKTDFNKGYYTKMRPLTRKDSVFTKDTDPNKQAYAAAYNASIPALASVTGKDPADLAQLAKIGYGIYGNETEFGHSRKARAKEIYATLRQNAGGRPASVGPFQIKAESNALTDTGKPTKLGRQWNELGINKNELYFGSSQAEDKKLNQNVKALVSRLSYYQDKFRKDPSMEYDPKTKTYWGSVPEEAVLAASHQTPNVKKEDIKNRLLLGSRKYAANALAHTQELENPLPLVKKKESTPEQQLEALLGKTTKKK